MVQHYRCFPGETHIEPTSLSMTVGFSCHLPMWLFRTAINTLYFQHGGTIQSKINLSSITNLLLPLYFHAMQNILPIMPREITPPSRHQLATHTNKKQNIILTYSFYILSDRIKLYTLTSRRKKINASFNLGSKIKVFPSSQMFSQQLAS